MAVIDMREGMYVAGKLANNPGILIPDRPIAFNRDFVLLGIRVTGALFLSQAIYWSKRTKDPEKWFYKTVEEWEEETGLTRDEQLSIKKTLQEKGFIEIEKRGIPAKNYYRINEDKIAESLVLYYSDNKSSGIPTTGSRESLPHSNTEITTENTTTENPKKDLSEFSHSEEEFKDDVTTEVTEDCEGFKHNSLSRPKKTGPNKSKVAQAIAHRYADTLSKDAGFKVIADMSAYIRILEAMKHLTEKQMDTMVEDALATGLARKRSYSLAAIFSNHEINRFKTENT